jgi:ribonuclease HI
MQYNVAKRREVMDSILNDKETQEYTLLLLQEPCRTYNQKTPLLHQSWTAIEPTHLTERPPRAAIYANNKKMAPAAFEQIPVPHSDIVAIAIAAHPPFHKPTLIVNLYNSDNHSLIEQLRTILLQHIKMANYEVVLVAGDFNLHHALWNPSGYTNQEPQAETLVEVMMEANLRTLLPPGTVTFPTLNETGGTAIDLVWGNENAEDIVLKCQTVEQTNDHGSDHHPIEIVLDLSPKKLPPIAYPYNYNKTNWELVKIELECLLPSLIDPNNITPNDLDNYSLSLSTAYQEAIAQQTPRKRPCPHSKRWWNDDLTALRKKANHLRNRYRRTQNDADGEEWSDTRKRYKDEIRGAKEKTWKTFVEEADEKSIWTVKKYIDKPPSPYYIPTINDSASNEGKAAEFANAFFPPPPPAETADINEATYPEPAPSNPIITINQVRRAINKISSKKAPGPDEIANITLKKTFDIAHQHLHTLIQASINIAHFPAPFKTTTTVILRKPAKPDYTKANAYRPIALENTLGKLIESIVTELLSHAAEEYQLIPAQHYGGRPGRTGEEAMIMLMEKIMHAWKEREVYSTVFMDVAGAFNNVHHERLLHNMKKRKVPDFIVRWTESFLKERGTRLRFNGVESERICTNAGVPQGSPISPILYLFYNADLLDIPGTRGSSLGFIDDIAYGVQGESDEDNVKELKKMLMKAEKWREEHGARFETSKYVLIHFTKSRSRHTAAHIDIGDTMIKPANEAKYLGVIFDRKLSFKHHTQYAAKKGTSLALAMSRIAKCTWGAAYQQTRILFTSVVAPRMDYAAIVWHKPSKQGAAPPWTATAKIDSVQRIAMKAILGTFRTTATSALQIETSLPPTYLRLRNKVLQSWTRMRTAPETHPINAAIRRASTSQSKTHITPLENLARSFPQYAATIETIKPHPFPPWWSPPFTIEVEGNKKTAKAKHDATQHEEHTLRIYTDGSGIDGHVGAAAFCPNTMQTESQYLGSEEEHNVYTAETTAFELAANIANTSPPAFTKCVIYADSQAAIKGISNPNKQSGQGVLISAINKIELLVNTRNMRTEIKWIPGHKDITGNETADKAAKQAAKSKGEDPTIPKSTHKSLKSARSVLIKRAITHDWSASWKSRTHDAKQLRRITNKPNVTCGIKLYKAINTRHQAAQLARLRTGHCSLNQFLHRFGFEDSPMCECGNDAIENVQHYLLHCPRYERQRAKLAKEVGIGGMWIEKLLGYPEMIQSTLEYIKETRRFTF